MRRPGSKKRTNDLRVGHLRPVGAPLAGERIYLAARFARQRELQLVANELEQAGATVVSSWLKSAPLKEAQLRTDGAAALLAEADLGDLRGATTCISFTESVTAPKGRGGRHVEHGIALALGLRTVVVGPREHLFHCLPVVEHYETWEDARTGVLKQQADAAAVA